MNRVKTLLRGRLNWRPLSFTVALFVTRADKSERARSAQQQSRWRQVRAFERRSCPANGAVSCRASDEFEYSGLPRRPGLKRAFDGEPPSRALVFEARAENSYARAHPPLSRSIDQAVMGHGDLLREYIRQLFPSISTISHHHKLALPIEAVRARARILFLWAWEAPTFFL